MYLNNNIALYGLGTETEKAISELQDQYNIVGLLDGFRDSGEIYGKPILKLADVPALDVSKIIVVARPGSCKAITKRIGDFCRDNDIELFDIRGKDLLLENKVSFDLNSLKGIRKIELMEKSKSADVVSFDLFDTLIMRRVFLYTDIFELMDDSLKKHGIYIEDFARLRLQAEKELSNDSAPTLTDIYNKVVDNTRGAVSAEELVQLEYDTDRKTLCLRNDMADIFHELVEAGKRVYITTDTYYRKNQIEKILESFGLTGYEDVLVSCEYDKGKRQGLFEILKDKTNNKYIYYNKIDDERPSEIILHIGDDVVSDIEAGESAGIETFKIYSAEELFDAVGGFGFEEYMNTLSDRIKVGMMNAVLFNSPFQFDREDKRIVLSDAGDIGYIICSPIICDFMIWFKDKINELNIDNVWFSARDGYLLNKLYEMMGCTNGVYFLTSRIAAIRAGVETEDDVSYVDSMKFFGTVEENLKVRFGLDIFKYNEKNISNDNMESQIKDNRIDSITVYGNDECFKSGINDKVDGEYGLAALSLKDYADIILNKALIQKNNYKKYIDELNLNNGDVVFFDFVAKGTTQMYVQRLTEHHIKGLYFLQLEPEFMKDKNLDIEPFYSQEEKDNSEIFDNYYILETLLTAPHPQIMEFDEDGKPVFADELRSEKDLKCFDKMQQGVIDFFRDYLCLVSETVHCNNKKLDEKMLSLIHGLKIDDEDFLSLIVEDPFFNRMTDLKDLI